MSETEPRDPATGSRVMRGARAAAGNRFVRETVVLQFGMVAQMATYLITSVVLARGLGPHDFGRYTLAFTLYTVAFFIANLGVTTATVSRYARARGSGDRQEQIAALAAFVKVFALMSAAIAAAGFAMPALASLLYDDADVGWFALALCFLGPVELTNGFMLVVLQGGRRMVDFVLFDNACGVVRLLVFVIALLSFTGLQGVIAAYLISGALYMVMALVRYRALRRELDADEAPPPLLAIVRAIPTTAARDLFSSGTLLAVSKNGGQMLRSFALLFGGKVAGTVAVADFRVAFYYVWAIQQLLNGLNRSLLPALGFRLGTKEGVAKFGHDLTRVALVSGCLFVAVTAVAVIAAQWLIPLLYGAHYDGAVKLVWLLAIGHLVLGFAVVIDPFYIYTEQIRVGAKRHLVSYALLVPCGGFLIWEYGIEGLAIFLALAQLVSVYHLFRMWQWIRDRRAREPGAPASGTL
jgi:O-antigen/teichoic acid export membrane protein